MCFLCDVSLSLLEKRRVLKEVQKKAVVVKSPFVQKEIRRKKERKEKGRRKKALGGVGIRFGFSRPKAHKKLLSSFSLDASVEEN